MIRNHTENKNNGVNRLYEIKVKLKKFMDVKVATANDPIIDIVPEQYFFSMKYAGKMIDVDMIALMNSMMW